MNGDQLHVDAPAGVVTPELRDELRRRKPDIIGILRTLDPDSSTADRRGGAEASAARPDGSKGAPARPARFSAPRQNRPTPPAADPADAGLPVRWRLDDLDRRVLLECGILPAPAVDDLPPAWRRDYDRLTP